ncbi:response regulator [Leptolyngbya ohadii]|uniref:response regulator n=1 Tax=Leptolyngbya ohadii TaxID=1962290 RepID=UPI0015C64669|nr:response regulator [Leptolyngbya ohadii]
MNESDEDDIEQVIRVCLEHIARWNVVSIAATDAGLLPLPHVQPDAILFNARLSRGSNLSFIQKQTLQHLRRYALTRFIPILLLIDTASWIAGDQLRSLGVAGAIAKPFNPVTLPEKISEIVGWNRF